MSLMLTEIMDELKALGKDQLKKNYMGQGAIEPLFGVATGAMKPILKRVGKNQTLAEELFATENYDAMYLAGMIAEPKKMTSEDFTRWIERAYFHMISDFVVSVTLAETDIAQEVADGFIDSGVDLTMSGGWSCYEWLLGSRKDEEFDSNKLQKLLRRVEETIHTQPHYTKQSMNRFVIAVGVSYTPLHDEAMLSAERMGNVTVLKNGKSIFLNNALERIQSEVSKGRFGFKRKHVRC